MTCKYHSSFQVSAAASVTRIRSLRIDKQYDELTRKPTLVEDPSSVLCDAEFIMSLREQPQHSGSALDYRSSGLANDPAPGT